MTAIITNQFRLQNLQYAKRDIDAGVDRYYLAIGRSQDWSNESVPPTPNIDYEDEISARLTMQSMKEITNIAYCAPRYNWVNGNTYVAYDDNNPTQSGLQYYVLNTSTFNVYICLRAGSGPSTIEPTGVDDGGSGLEADRGSVTPTAGSDGYVWKFLYTISAADANKYLTTDFMPVFRDTNVAANATLGQIWDYNIVSGGAGYDTAPTVTIEGNGSGATAIATISGGAITAINVTAVGSGYTYARVVLSGGTPETTAVIAPVLGPVSLGREVAGINVTNGGTGYTNGSLSLSIDGDGFGATATATVSIGVIQAGPTGPTINTAGYNYTNATITPNEVTAGTPATFALQLSGQKGGFGYDPVVDLQANYLMFNIVLDGAEGSGDFVPGINYRQLMILKNPLDRSSPQVPFTQSTGTAMPFLDVDPDGTWVNGEIITGGTSGAQAYVVYYDSANEYLYINQNNETGYDSFASGESLSGSTSIGAVAAGGQSNPSEIDNLSGRLLYLENRASVSRGIAQTEDIKLVTQF